MAKKKIKFKVTDGVKPRKSEGPGKPFSIMTPVDVNLPARTTRTLKLGVSCEAAVVLTCGGVATLFAPGQELVAQIGGLEDTNLSRGEVVAKAFVLDNSDVELADA